MESFLIDVVIGYLFKTNYVDMATIKLRQLPAETLCDFQSQRSFLVPPVNFEERKCICGGKFLQSPHIPALQYHKQWISQHQIGLQSSYTVQCPQANIMLSPIHDALQ